VFVKPRSLTEISAIENVERARGAARRGAQGGNAFHGYTITVAAAFAAGAQFAVGVEYCVLLIADVTRLLLLNVARQ